MKKTETLKSLLVNEELHLELKLASVRNGKKMKHFVEEILVNYLESQKNP